MGVHTLADIGTAECRRHVLGKCFTLDWYFCEFLENFLKCILIMFTFFHPLLGLPSYPLNLMFSIYSSLNPFSSICATKYSLEWGLPWHRPARGYTLKRKLTFLPQVSNANSFSAALEVHAHLTLPTLEFCLALAWTCLMLQAVTNTGNSNCSNVLLSCYAWKTLSL